MPLMTKLKEIMPWKRKPVETHEVMSLRDDINQLFDFRVSYEHEAEWRPNDGEGSGRRYTVFHRTVALPEGVDDERAEATCKHGLLTVRIPWRREASQRSHRLTVSVE